MNGSFHNGICACLVLSTTFEWTGLDPRGRQTGWTDPRSVVSGFFGIETFGPIFTLYSNYWAE